MKNSDYWKERFEQQQEELFKSSDEYLERLDKLYKKTTANIEKEILQWYARFVQNNDIDMATARRMLSNKELKELKWDIEEYIKKAEENSLNGEWVKELENASVRVHISRLESLKLQIQQQVEVLYGNQADSLDKLIKNIYSEGYYRTVFEIHKGTGVFSTFNSLDSRKIEKVINTPWSVDGTNFSTRIWNNKNKLINTLNNELSYAVIRGESPQKTISIISKEMNTSRNNAGRIVMTESAYFSSLAQKDCYKELDVEKYEILATLDSHTSKICQELDGKVFDMKDYQPGVTAPPFHVYCRSTTVPYFEEDYGVKGERAARDEKGKTCYVSEDMTYSEWKDRLISEDVEVNDIDYMSNSFRPKFEKETINIVGNIEIPVKKVDVY